MTPCPLYPTQGIMNTDFASLINSASVYAAIGSQLSIASGRLSFALGTQGPCATIDTACSSALVALDAGLQNFRSTCNMALAAAVNVRCSCAFECLRSLAIRAPRVDVHEPNSCRAIEAEESLLVVR